MLSTGTFTLSRRDLYRTARRMNFLTLQHTEDGSRRLWLFDRYRIHGFLCGLLLCGFSFGAGVALVVHDWHDRSKALRLI
ncbi:MAG: hypothetical protein KGZ65_00030 [Sphingomonadales bacterium]|nr:hypothetical protein [Sphingomonadaceae bacterium]MBS3929593.1 hypothetical protein [Sphingomonadales bacterium]